MILFWNGEQWIPVDLLTMQAVLKDRVDECQDEHLLVRALNMIDSPNTIADNYKAVDDDDQPNFNGE